MKKIKSFAIFKRAFPYIKKYKHLFIFDLIFSVAATMCEIIFPKLLKYTAELVSSSLEKKIAIPYNTIIKNASIFFVLAVLEIIGIYYMNYIGHLTGAKIETDMRRDLFSHLQKLNIGFFTDIKTGQLLSRFTHDLSKITEFIHHLPEQIMITTLKFTFCTFFMLTINFYIGLVILIFAPIMFITCRYYNVKMQKAFHKNAVQLGEMNSQVENSLLGIQITKSFANEQYEKKKFEIENIKTYETKKILYKNLGQFNGIMRLFVLSAYLLVAATGLLQLIKGNIKATSYITCFMYADMFLKQMINLLHILEKYQEGHTPLIRFFEILDQKSNILEIQGKSSVKDFSGKIEFKDAYFRYNDKDNYVLNSLNLTIKPKQKAALIGISGAGKTTICSLIQRFYDLTAGEILIDDINIKDIPLNQLHKIIGVVEQNVFLFPGTIYDNILYGNIKANKEEVEQAAKDAGLFDFISSLPEKFQTNIGERGIKLSGGQRQRISIARIFLKNPKILILDEAASSLDYQTEEIIRKSLNRLSKDKTTIIISHKLSTIKTADTILILKDGKIAEKGKHEELLTNNNLYKNFFNNF